jgi:hypothetical protein
LDSKRLGQVSNGKLPNDVKGNLATINLMIEVARLRASEPLIRKLALNILNFYNTKSNNYADEALAIGEYVQKHVTYVRDPDQIEYLQCPLDLVGQIQDGTARGDCDDMALLIATLLLSIGHKPFYRAARYDSSFGNYNHIYVVDYEKNMGGPLTRICLDAIIKTQPIGFEVQQASGDEFAV